MIENGYFKLDDPKAAMIMGYPISPGSWSRKYEYPWALEYAEEDQVVADMGCGWSPRPFKDALAALGCQVYAVDGNERLLTQEKRPGLEFVIADITKPIEEIPAGSLDRVFCISVLEDVGDKVPLALQEFSRCLKPGGVCVLTFDVRYDTEKPLAQWPGVKIEKFQDLLKDVDLEWMEPPDFDKSDVLFNEEFNLCVFHCSLTKQHQLWNL